MIFDTHAHYDNQAFDPDRDSLLSSLPDHGIGAVVNVGASIESTERAIDLTGKYPFIYGVAGVHPSECGGLEEKDIQWLKQQASLEKIVAIGEIGLDYYWEEPEHQIGPGEGGKAAGGDPQP